MGDDFATDDILSVGGTDTDVLDFDPNAVESDDFLDDPKEVLLPDEVDELAEEEEDDNFFGEDE